MCTIKAMSIRYFCNACDLIENLQIAIKSALTIETQPTYGMLCVCTICHLNSMMEASYHGHNDCISLLHNAGALWSQRDHSGMYSISHNLQHALSPPSLSSGMSVLHWAVDGEQIKTIEYLLNQGIPVRDNILFLTPHFPPLRLMMLLTLQSLAGRLCCALVITILFVFIFTFYACAHTHTQLLLMVTQSLLRS